MIGFLFEVILCEHCLINSARTKGHVHNGRNFINKSNVNVLTNKTIVFTCFRDSIRQRHTGDGREMSESRSRLGLGLSTLDSRHTAQQAVDSNGLDLYYNR